MEGVIITTQQIDTEVAWGVLQYILRGRMPLMSAPRRAGALKHGMDYKITLRLVASMLQPTNAFL
jgi:hypothetical protein